jgi:hypothetical protein
MSESAIASSIPLYENTDSTPPRDATETNEPAKASGKRGPSGLTALLAEHFDINEEKTTQTCPICRKTWIYSVTRQQRHLETIHPERAGFIAVYKRGDLSQSSSQIEGSTPSSSMPSIPRLSKAQQQDLERSLDRYASDVVFKQGKPLNFWDKDHNPDLYDMQTFMAEKMGIPKWSPPSRWQQTARLDDYYSQEEAHVMKILSEHNELHFCFDGSSDPANRRVFNACVTIPSWGQIFLENINMGEER